MLTKTDLKQIGQIVQSETRKVVQSETRKVVQSETRKIVQSETRKIVQEEIETELKPIKKNLALLQKDMEKVRTDIDVIINFFDQEYLGLRRRVTRIEEHLDLPSLV
ncbi:hypothetical protein ACFLZP_03435 [Patescibacteria group bacterium]